MTIAWLPTVYNQHRSEFGRLSSGLDKSDPEKGTRSKVMQMQNIPKSIRDMFVALPGQVLIGGDEKAIEWCVMMWYASKLPYSKGFHADLLSRFCSENKEGKPGAMDPHKFLASVCYNIPEEKVTKMQRQAMKPYTYGYWENPISVGRRVGHRDEVALVIGKAHERAFHMTPLREWMVAETKKRKRVQTPLGWVAWFWDWNPKPEEVYAGYGQGTAANLLLWLKVRILAKLPKAWQLLTDTHDSFLLMVPEADKEDAKHFLKTEMEQPVPWMDNFGWVADVKDGPNWMKVS